MAELGTDRGWDRALERWSVKGLDAAVRKVGGRVASRAGASGRKVLRPALPVLTGRLRSETKAIRMRSVRGSFTKWAWAVRWTADPVELARARKPGGVPYWGRIVSGARHGRAFREAYARAVTRASDYWARHAGAELSKVLEGRDR